MGNSDIFYIMTPIKTHNRYSTKRGDRPRYRKSIGITMETRYRKCTDCPDRDYYGIYIWIGYKSNFENFHKRPR